MKEVIRARFRANGNNGKVYEVRAIQFAMSAGEVFDTGTLSNNPADWTYLTSGQQVTRHSKGHYQIFETDIVLTSTDPNAV